jgi:hypothetical protein
MVEEKVEMTVNPIPRVQKLSYRFTRGTVALPVVVQLVRALAEERADVCVCVCVCMCVGGGRGWRGGGWWRMVVCWRK